MRATQQAGGRVERWVHDETGLVADSAVVDPGGDGGRQYCLTVSLADGARCSAAIAFMALADFGLLAATEDERPGRSQRVFRLPVPAGL